LRYCGNMTEALPVSPCPRGARGWLRGPASKDSGDVIDVGDAMACGLRGACLTC